MAASKTLIGLFGAEVALAVFSVAAAIHAAAASKPWADFAILAGAMFLGALSSYPVVVGFGLGLKFRKFLCGAFIAFAIAMSFSAVYRAARAGEALALREEGLDRELEKASFELEYPDDELGARHFEMLRLDRASMLAEKRSLSSRRSGVLTGAIPVLAGAFLLLVINVVYLAEAARMAGRRGRS